MEHLFRHLVAYQATRGCLRWRSGPALCAVSSGLATLQIAQQLAPRWPGVALPQGERYRAKSIASPKMLPVGADVAMMPASPLVVGFYIRDAVTHRSAILHRLPRRHHAAAVVPAAHQPAAVLVAVKDKPFGRPQEAAVLDGHSAR